jgi:nitrate/nitrite transporter NarK
MAGLKAIVLWFPPERVALANGVYIMLGALGALSATGPAEAVVQALGWRGLFALLAVASAAVALLILLVVPEKEPAPAVGSAPKISFLTIFRDPRFWRIAPLGATGVGISWSLQGLWAAPWLTDVERLDRPAVVEHLTLMAAVLSVSALLLGALAERLRRAGISTEVFLAGTLALSMAAQVLLLLGAPLPSHLMFAVIAAAGATTVLSFAILARYFPKELVGRANAALGVLNMGTAFGLQCLSGLIIAQWPADGRHYPAIAHQAAMATGLGLQLIALGVFFTPKPRLEPALMAHAVASALGLGRPASPTVLRPAYSSWTRQAELARSQTAAWRFAAAASAALCVGLAATLSMAISRPAVALHVIELSAPAGLSN